MSQCIKKNIVLIHDVLEPPKDSSGLCSLGQFVEIGGHNTAF